MKYGDSWHDAEASKFSASKQPRGEASASRTTSLITGSIAYSAKRRYLSYSEADFGIFHPTWMTRCTDGGEIWHSLLHAKFHTHQCNDKGIGPQKLKILLKF